MKPARDSAVAGFSAGWLQQREPFDAAARAAAAPRLALAARLAALRPGGGAPWRVIDLACGTGANLRWLAPRLGGRQEWLVLDHDEALLRQWPQRLADVAAASAPVGAGQGLRRHRDQPFHVPLCLTDPPGADFEATVVRQQIDLASSLHSLPWAHAQLVTASALLDLVSAGWLKRLVRHVAAARTAVLLALSVDGRHAWSPRDRDDGLVAALFAAHQRRDKGFGGPALGAAAVPAGVQALRAAGYRVASARSEWVLDGRTDPQALALQCALHDGMAAAACEQRPAAAPVVRAWQQRRLAVAAHSTLRVGHVDVLAMPPR